MELFSGYLGALLAVLVFGCFIKVATVLGIVRYGLGLTGPAFGVVIFVVSLIFALSVVDPKLQSAGGADLFAGKGSLTQSGLEGQFRPFLVQHTQSEVLQKFERMSGAKESDSVPFRSLIAAFLVSELHDAFRLGVILLIPFVIIDLAVANIFMLLSITQLSVQSLALPLKLLLFVAVNGWQLVAERLLAGYAG